MVCLSYLPLWNPRTFQNTVFMKLLVSLSLSFLSFLFLSFLFFIFFKFDTVYHYVALTGLEHIACWAKTNKLLPLPFRCVLELKVCPTIPCRFCIWTFNFVILYSHNFNILGALHRKHVLRVILQGIVEWPWTSQLDYGVRFHLFVCLIEKILPAYRPQGL